MKRCRNCGREILEGPANRVFCSDYCRKQAWELRNNFGIDRTERDRMAEAQGYRCAICGAEVPLCVDHDHKTGQVRGLLCNSCNSWLGTIGDNPLAPQRAYYYLKRKR